MNNIDGKFWDEKYAGVDSVYGKEPNKFFKEQIGKLKPGKILIPGDAEGRNGVYAAVNGWIVNSVDYSQVAHDKAVQFAHDSGTEISYLVIDLSEYEPHKNYYDAVGIIFLHLSEELRKTFLKKTVQSLKPGGTIIFEAFAKDQLGRDSGGPQDASMLYELEEIKNLFSGLKQLLAVKEIVNLTESKFHSGEASVIRFVGQKEN